MKELSIEEKAKRYDEAIKVAKSNYETIVQMDKECTFAKEEMLSWLEKQGEQKHKIQPKFKIGDIIRFKGNETLKGEAETHKIVSYDNELYVFADGTTDLFCEQDLYELVEQNLADKVGPKFKVGDWVVSDDKDVHDDYRVCKITKIDNGRYYIEGGSFLSESSLALYEYRPWTIQDAKDGDVLADGRAILLFRSIGNRSWKNVISYYAILETNLNNRFSISDDEEYWGRVQDCELKPASKEQRDTLIKAIADAGYTFDFEKKELRKIEQKQVIDYSNNLPKDNWEFIREFITKFGRMPKDEDELNVLVQYVLKRQKPTWSEEDKTNIHRALFYVNFYQTHEADTKESGECFDWLKSLRPQNTWKPSNEQMKALQWIIDGDNPENWSITINNLYNDLKKLKGCKED